MQRRDLLIEADIKTDALDAWMESGWLMPRHNGKSRSFTEIDLARVHLIRDLQVMGVNEESIPIILDLLDQMYGLRRVLRMLLTEFSAAESERH